MIINYTQTGFPN